MCLCLAVSVSWGKGRSGFALKCRIRSAATSVGHHLHKPLSLRLLEPPVGPSRSLFSVVSWGQKAIAERMLRSTWEHMPSLFPERECVYVCLCVNRFLLEDVLSDALCVPEILVFLYLNCFVYSLSYRFKQPAWVDIWKRLRKPKAALRCMLHATRLATLPMCFYFVSRDQRLWQLLLAWGESH